MADKKEKPKEKKKFECQYCGQTFNKLNSKTNHEKNCEANPNSPKSLKKLEDLKKTREELQKPNDPGSNPSIPQPPQQLPQVEQEIENQTFNKQREDDFLDLKRENKITREILLKQQQDKQLSSALGERNPLDTLAQTLQIKNMASIGQDKDSGQTQNLLNLQAQNYQSQITTQGQMFEMQKQLQAQQFDFFKQQLANEKDKNSGLSQIKEVTELAKELGWKKDDSDKGAGEYLMENIGKIVEVAAPILKEMNQQKQEQVTPEQAPTSPTSPQPQTPPVPEVVTDIPGEKPKDPTIGLQFPGDPIAPPEQDVPQPTIAPQQLTDEEVEKYAQAHHIEGAGDNDPNKIIDQALGMGDYARARKEYKK